METKNHRYMQRIEKIMNTPTRTVSPLRPTKSPLKCRTNQLDQYLKYQLSAKIVGTFINRHQQHLINVFFKHLKRTEHLQKERVYKFVAIETNSIKVDFGISAKLMVSAIKQIFKNRYTHFLQRIPNRQPSFQQSSSHDSEEKHSFKKNKAQTMKSAVLMRTASRPDAKNYREVSEWNYDAESSKGKSLNYDKYQKMKGYILKTLLKLVNSKLKQVKGLAMKKLQTHSLVMAEKKKYELKSVTSSHSSKQMQEWKKKEDRYKGEIADLQEALMLEQKKSDQMFQNNMQLDEELRSAEKKKTEYLYWQKMQSLIQMGYAYIKKKNITDLKLGTLKYNMIKKRKNNSQAIVRGLSHLNKYSIHQKKKGLQSIINMATIKKQGEFTTEIGSLHIFYTLQNNLLQKYHASLIKLILNATQSYYQIQKIEQINNREIEEEHDLVELPISTINPVEDLQSENLKPLQNLNSFVDKFFRFILILSKLLIPIKQAFGKIDQFASYNYRVQESFKSIYFRPLKEAFECLKCSKVQPQKQLLPLLRTNGRLIQKMDKLFYKRLIEPFSLIKITSREKDLKIKIFPVRSSIVEQTKTFLEERNIYLLYSQDHWSKIKENKFSDIVAGNPELETFGKKRSNTTY